MAFRIVIAVSNLRRSLDRRLSRSDRRTAVFARRKMFFLLLVVVVYMYFNSGDAEISEHLVQFPIDPMQFLSAPLKSLF